MEDSLRNLPRNKNHKELVSLLLIRVFDVIDDGTEQMASERRETQKALSVAEGSKTNSIEDQKSS